jgi:hypothetical protein
MTKYEAYLVPVTCPSEKFSIGIWSTEAQAQIGAEVEMQEYGGKYEIEIECVYIRD